MELAPALSFTDLIRQRGIPTDNLNPGTREQIAIYQKGETVSFYYFRENILQKEKEYSAAEIDRMKDQQLYPQQIFKDLGVN